MPISSQDFKDDPAVVAILKNNMLKSVFTALWGFLKAAEARILNGKWWAFKSALLLFIAGFIVALPAFDGAFMPAEYPLTHEKAWEMKVQEPFNDMSAWAAGTHYSKRTFRILAPLLAQVMVYDTILIRLLEIGAGFGVILYSLLIGERISRSKRTAFAVGLQVSMLFAFVNCVLSAVNYRFDTLTLLLLVMAVYYRGHLLAATLCFLAFWIDERGFTASPFVILFHVLAAKTPNQRLGVMDFLKNPITYTVPIAWISYFLLRQFLEQSLNLQLSLSDIGLGIFANTAHLAVIAMGMFTGLEYGWVVVFFAAFFAMAHKEWFLILTVSVGSIPTIIGSIGVLDISRGSQYFLLLYFVCLLLLKNWQLLKSQIVKGVIVGAAILSIYPSTVYVIGPSIRMFFPMPVEVVRSGYLILNPEKSNIVSEGPKMIAE